MEQAAQSNRNGIQEDWLYEEPFKSELNKRIKSAKEEMAANKLVKWKPKRKNRM